MTRTDYQTYIERYCEDVEGFQDGYRYVELDLFSHMTTGAYLKAFRSHGLRVDELILQLSSPGLRFRRTFPEQYERLLDATEGRCAPDDLVVTGNLARLTRAAA